MGMRPVLSCLCVLGLAACNGGDNGSGTQAGYAEHALVSDGALMADHTDADLVNAWGLAFNPQGFAWVANNGSDKSTLYDGNGVKQSLVVAIPAGSRGGAGVTGVVFNGSGNFVVTSGGKSGAAGFVFDTEGGTVAAWAPDVDLNNAITVYDDGAGGAIYKGLAIIVSGGTNRLYASDFHNNKVDVFDASFNKIAVAGGFADATMPAGFAPFGIQAINGQLVVTYAQQDAAAEDELHGAGLGYVDLFDGDGNLVKRLVSQGALNAPWGIALAPNDFGPLSNDLLIGNFGDGKVNAYNMSSGAFVDALKTPGGTPIAVDGLWAIAFGNDLNSQPHNTLFYTAGPNDEADGLYGRFDAVTVTNGMCSGYGC